MASPWIYRTASKVQISDIDDDTFDLLRLYDSKRSSYPIFFKILFLSIRNLTISSPSAVPTPPFPPGGNPPFINDSTLSFSLIQSPPKNKTFLEKVNHTTLVQFIHSSLQMQNP